MIVTAHSAFVSGLGEGSIAESYSRDARNVARDMPFYLSIYRLQRRVGWSRRSMAARKPGGGAALSFVPPSTCPCIA